MSHSITETSTTPATYTEAGLSPNPFSQGGHWATIIGGAGIGLEAARCRVRAGLLKTVLLLVSGFLLFGAGTVRAQAPTACAAPDPNFHVYLLMGQSNMAGRGPITDALAVVGNARVYMLNAAGEWVPGRHPVHFDKPKVAGVGPGLSFGVALALASPGVKIGIVPCAVGGTAINYWKPGTYDSITNTHPYDDAVQRIAVAMRCGVVKGMLWHQGEADCNPRAMAVYLPKLTELIERVRVLTGQPGLPVVAGELGRFKEKNINFNTQLLHLPEVVPHTAVATSENLVDKGDQTHFDGASADEFGRRYAVKMEGLQADALAAQKASARTKKHPEKSR